MKHCFIINPAAGKGGHAEQLQLRLEQLGKARGLDFEIHISGAPGMCGVLARQAARDGQPCRLYACGGDGTLNEVVNGVADLSNAWVTHLPTGSGNDFVKSFSDPAAFRDPARLLDCEQAELDLIRVGPRLCVDICSIGIDARVGTSISKYKNLPLVTGSGAYALSLLVNVVKGVHEHYVIDIDGQHIDGEQTMICACNGRWYGGGYNPVPEARLDDGLMDVLLVKPVSRLKVAQVVGKYKAGQYRQVPELIRAFRVREFRVRCDRPTTVNVDGEIVTATQMDFAIAREKLRFFYPRGLSYQPPETALAAAAAGER